MLRFRLRPVQQVSVVCINDGLDVQMTRQIIAEKAEQDRPDNRPLWDAVGDSSRSGATTADHLTATAQVAGEPRGIDSIPPQLAQESAVRLAQNFTLGCSTHAQSRRPGP